MTYISAERRKKSATVRVKSKDGKEKDKFPVDSKATAQSALRMEHFAKPPLTSSQKSAIKREAAKFGVPAKKPSKKPAKKAEK